MARNRRSCKPEDLCEILLFRERIFPQNLLTRGQTCDEFENPSHCYAHATNTGLPPGIWRARQ